MKKLALVLLLVPLFVKAPMVYAGVGFDASHGFNLFNDDRWEGSNQRFGFIVDINDDTSAGYFFEEAGWDWRADVGEAIPNFVNTSAHIHGFRIMKKVNRIISAGMDLGAAQISVRTAGGTTATMAAAAPLNQTKPFVDLLGRAEYAVKNEKGMSSGVFLDVGYRFLDLNDVTTAGVLGAAGEETIKDLNSLLVGVGVFIGF